MDKPNFQITGLTKYIKEREKLKSVYKNQVQASRNIVLIFSNSVENEYYLNDCR